MKGFQGTSALPLSVDARLGVFDDEKYFIRSRLVLKEVQDTGFLTFIIKHLSSPEVCELL